MKDINNPIATNDQAEHELLANEIFNDEEILDWREHIRSYWLDLVKPSEVMLSCFDKAFDEVMFGAVIWGLNQDPSYPKVITIRIFGIYIILMKFFSFFTIKLVKNIN